MDFLKEAARRFPDRPAVDDGDGTRSYRALDARVDALARGLASAASRPAGRIALLLEGGAAVVAALHAVPRSRAAVAPLSPRLTPFELATALPALDATLLVAGAGTRSLARSAVEASGLAVPILDVAEAEEAGRGLPPAAAAPDVRRPDEWAVLWTSGTAGRPRGVCLTAANLAASAEGCRERLGLGPEDRWCLSLSAAHVGGLALVTRAALLGSAVVAAGPFSTEAFDALVDEGRVTHASLVPTMLLRVLEARGGRPPPPSLRCVLVGGAHAPAALVERALTAGFPIALTYGSTEATSQVATARPALVREKPGTVGPPLPGVEVRVDGGGEILVRGPTVAERYLGDEGPVADPDGWLHTGDLGEIDADGHLRVVGRRSDRIVSGGVNVDPAEVEEVLRRHPGVEDAAVVGLPDPEWGESVAAALVRRVGADAEVADLDALARGRLGAAKLPRRWAFLEALPRNANGKVDREAVRRLILEGGPA